jgi:aldose 1-epimerase
VKAHFLAALGALLVASATLSAEAGIQKMPFGSADGKPVDLYILTSPGGVVAKVMTYGATLTELDVPDRNGKLDDVILGFPTLDGYLGKEPYFGATVGRVGNRIAKGIFTLGGTTYHLATNNGVNHLHGGNRGFDKVVWSGRDASNASGPAVEFTYLSPDGEEGYPGNCRVSVTYQLTESTLSFHYVVTTDKDTPVNVTNHTYYNLSGAENGDILGHELRLYADRFTPVDSTLIPTGELKPVAGTPMDFRKATAIGARIKQVGGDPIGYDHNWVVNVEQEPGDKPLAFGDAPGSFLHVATVHDPFSGRTLDVWSTEPGIQFYSGNFLDGTITGKKGVVYNQYWGLCLETQHFPDSVNHPNFPSYVLKAGSTYTSASYYFFTAR